MGRYRAHGLLMLPKCRGCGGLEKVFSLVHQFGNSTKLPFDEQGK